MNKKYNESNRNLNHLDPSAVTENSLLDLDKDKWHTTYIQSVELFNKEGSLCINHQNITVPHFYVSYLEKNSNFSILPTVECEISPGKTYSVEFYGNVDKEVNMELFLIYYTNQTKVHTESFTLNTTSSLVISNDVEGIRVAVRISGKGTSFINKIQFTDKNDIKNSSIRSLPDRNSSSNTTSLLIQNDAEKEQLIKRLIKEKENLEKEFKEILEFILKDMKKQELLYSSQTNQLLEYKDKYETAIRKIKSLEIKLNEMK
ncbi:hypothetical protein [Priestia megaterium]